EACRLDRLDVQLDRTLLLEQVDPAVDDDPQPGLRLEHGPGPLVAEPDAVEGAAGVLEGEIGVSGAADRDPTDLALDPDVGESRVGSDGLADRPGDVADIQDPQPEGPGRGLRRGLSARCFRVDGVPAGEERPIVHRGPW